MGRDGLQEVNHTTGKTERISGREQDFAIGSSARTRTLQGTRMESSTGRKIKKKRYGVLSPIPKPVGVKDNPVNDGELTGQTPDSLKFNENIRQNRLKKAFKRKKEKDGQKPFSISESRKKFNQPQKDVSANKTSYFGENTREFHQRGKSDEDISESRLKFEKKKEADRKKREKKLKKVQRLQQQAEKADWKWESAGQRVQKEIYKGRLRFDEKSESIQVNSSKPRKSKIADAAFKTAERLVRSEQGEEDDQNQPLREGVGLIQGGRSLRFGVKQFQQTGRRRRSEKLLRRLDHKEKRAVRSHTRLKWEQKKTGQSGSTLSNQPLKSWTQKQQIKKSYQRAYRACRNEAAAAAHTARTVSFAGKAARATKSVAALFKGTALIAALCLSCVLFVAAGLSSCMAVASQSTGMFMGSTWTAENEDIDHAELYWTDMESKMRKELDEIPRKHPNYNSEHPFDEYRYEGLLEHDPFEVGAFLSALYEDFSGGETESVLKEIFESMYWIELTKVIEKRPIPTNNGVKMVNWYVLIIKFQHQTFDDAVRPLLEEKERYDLYQVYIDSRSNHQVYGNPFTYDWKSSVSSLFGWRVDPFTYEKKLHKGLDIAAPEGTPIRAVKAGMVVEARVSESYGNVITVRHENGVESKYAHCQSLLAAVGQTVEQGETIALVGSTGQSTGNHLHIEMSFNGQLLNPVFLIEYIEAKE